MATLGDIEKKTIEYAQTKSALDEVMAELSIETEQLKKKYLPRLKSIMGRVATKHAELYREIAENPRLFEKPKSIIIEGINVGFRKGKGKLEIPDPQHTLKLIKSKLPDQASLLIETIEEPVVSAIRKLSEKEQAMIHVEMTGKEDKVIIESVETVVGKVLDSLLKIQTKELCEEYEVAA